MATQIHVDAISAEYGSERNVENLGQFDISSKSVYVYQTSAVTSAINFVVKLLINDVED